MPRGACGVFVESRFKHVCVESIGHALPSRVVTSLDLERRLKPCYERLGFSEGRIELMSGIRERRFFDPGTRPSAIAASAAEIALGDFPRERIGALIHSSVCRDFMEPATASVVHAKLGLSRNCTLFDLSDACLGFANAMIVVATMIEQGSIEAGLVVAGEDGGPLVEATIKRLNEDPSINRKNSKLSFASLTIGSAGAAMLLMHEKISKCGHRLLGGVMRAATEHNHLCHGGQNERGDVLMETDSETLMQEGVKLAAATWRDTRELLGWSNANVQRVFTHQVGVAHRKLVFSTLELDPKLDFPTVEFLGNTGSAALPVGLSLGTKELKRGDNVALLGIGSGLVCANLGVQW
ncbi:MAG: 3-oxoacyl-ACP synthase III [Planctomycetes bacterium]|nr:3-oxoacyl-ACP synthase III [Planctomycetota bacterium]